MSRLMLAPSILNADFGNLERSLSYIEQSSDVVHLDVMDGNFVPNLTFGPMVVKAIRSLTSLPLDSHLMIADPLRYIGEFRAAGYNPEELDQEMAKEWVAAIAEIKSREGRPAT